jgi:HK97 family phage portal protein
MLSSLLRGRTEVRDQATPWGNWPAEFGATWAGVRVDQTSALQLSTVYGCVRLISDGISTLPVDVFRRQSDGTAIPIAAPQWLQMPTADLTFADWCGQVLAGVLLHGNAYIEVTRNATGSIVELVPRDPLAITVRRQDGRKVYYFNGRLTNAELVHIKGMMLPGQDVGLSPLEYARQTIGIGIATAEYGAKFFDGEGNMPGVIESPRMLPPETMKAYAENWQKKRNRRNRGLPGVLQGGDTWKPTGVTNEQAQFLATRQYTAAQIAGEIYLIDPSDLGIPVVGTSLTYANLADRNTRRVQVTFLPWLVRLESAISALLSNPRYIKFNVDALLRSDVLARWRAYDFAERINASAVTRGDQPVLTTAEMRELEDLGPVEGIDSGNVLA